MKRQSAPKILSDRRYFTIQKHSTPTCKQRKLEQSPSARTESSNYWNWITAILQKLNIRILFYSSQFRYWGLTNNPAHLVALTSYIYLQFYIFTLKLTELYNLCQWGSISYTFFNQYILKATILFSTTRSRKPQQAFWIK